MSTDPFHPDFGRPESQEDHGPDSQPAPDPLQPGQIDFPSLIDGLSVVAQTVSDGQGGLGAIDGLLITVTAAAGAAGATFVEFDDDGSGRVVAAAGAMAFAAGRPVPPEVIDFNWNGMWAGPTSNVPGRVGELLRTRGILASVGYPLRMAGRAVGSVNLYFTVADPTVWRSLEQAMRLIAAVMSCAYAAEQPLRSAVLDEDDRALFLAVTGHELRTPATVVKGYANMLADRWDYLDESHRRAGVKVLAQRADEMARLVDRMLGASIGDAPPGRLVRTASFDVVGALQWAVQDLPVDLRDMVRLDLPPRLPAAIGDPAMLNPIISELVINAMRYSPGPVGTGSVPGSASGAGAGGPEVEPAVEIQADADEHIVAIRVCDRGVGIDPAHVERAFERFWRDSRDADQRGVGLGLYLVRRLVERQHGWVSLRPRDGGGTIAEVRLRRADAMPPLPAVPPVTPVTRSAAGAAPTSPRFGTGYAPTGTPRGGA